MISTLWIAALSVAVSSAAIQANVTIAIDSTPCSLALTNEGEVAGREDQLVAAWADSLADVFFSDPSTTLHVSRLERVQYKMAFWLLKKTVEGLDVEGPALELQLGRALRSRARGRLSRMVLGRAHRQVIVGGADHLPRLHLTMRAMLDLACAAHPKFERAFERYREIFGRELFSEESFRTALMNVYAMRLFQKIESKVDSSKLPAIDAAALLHPVFDGPEDRGEVAPESLGRIARAVSGSSVEGENPFEDAVLALIRTIYETHPPAQHPRLKWIFTNLLRAQRASEGQKNAEAILDRDLFRLTVMKGGLSTALFAYVSLGGLDDAQFEFYFRAGTLFQLLDDLNDAKLDAEVGIRTLFSGVDDPVAWFAKATRLVSLWRDLAERMRPGSVMDFLSISIFSQAMAGLDLLPRNFRAQVIAVAASSALGLEVPRAEDLFYKIIACMRLSLARIEDPFFTEIENFLWKGKRDLSEASLSKRHEDLVCGFVDQLCTSGISYR